MGRIQYYLYDRIRKTYCVLWLFKIKNLIVKTYIFLYHHHHLKQDMKTREFNGLTSKQNFKFYSLGFIAVQAVLCGINITDTAKMIIDD